jgi:hypothetical protein
MNLQPILNKKLPLAHMKSTLGVLGVARKLVKDEFHSQPKKIGQNLFSSLHVIQKAKSQNLVLKNFRVNL